MTDETPASHAGGPWTSLVDLLRWRCRHEPDRRAYTFLIDGDHQEVHASHADLDRRARSIGAALQQRGARGERVLLLCSAGLEYIAAFFGCLYAGAVPVPAYPPPRHQMRSAARRLGAIVEDAEARFLVSTGDLASRVARLAAGSRRLGGLTCLTTAGLEECSPDDWREEHPDGASVAFLQYTSGATGLAKGVALSHRNLLYSLSVIHTCFGPDPESRAVIWLPPYHDMGLIGGVLEPLYAGLEVVLLPALRFIQRPVLWLRAISRYRAAFSGGPNFAYDLCVRRTTPEQREGLDLRTWRVAFNGAEAVRAETLGRFADTFRDHGFAAKAFRPCYGLAEATLLVTAAPRPRSCFFDSADLEAGLATACDPAPDSPPAAARALVSCGPPGGEEDVRIVDPEHRRPCAPGRIGEIWLRGPGVSRGYWNRGGEAEVFRARLADTGDGPFLRTGDLGFFFEGELFVTGRLKELIVIRGRKVHPQDIERTVESSHPGLREGEGAAFAVEARDGEALIVVQAVERSGAGRFQAAKARERIVEAVARDHGLHVGAVVLVKPGVIPRSSSGKIMRIDCRRLFLAGRLDRLEGTTSGGLLDEGS